MMVQEKQNVPTLVVLGKLMIIMDFHCLISLQKILEILVLQGAGGQEQRFHEAHIEEMTQQPVSIMPDGLEQKLSRAQLRDLLAYLKSLK